MRLSASLSDDAILGELGQRARAWRLRQNLSQDDVATRAGVSRRTVQALESGASVQLGTLLRVLRVLDLLGGLEAAIPPVGPSPLELVERRGNIRQRASGTRGRGEGEAGEDAEAWTWGDDS